MITRKFQLLYLLKSFIHPYRVWSMLNTFWSFHFSRLRRSIQVLEWINSKFIFLLNRHSLVKVRLLELKTRHSFCMKSFSSILLFNVLSVFDQSIKFFCCFFYFDFLQFIKSWLLLKCMDTLSIPRMNKIVMN